MFKDDSTTSNPALNEIMASIRQTVTDEMANNERSTSAFNSLLKTGLEEKNNEDVLELTNVVQDDGTVVDMTNRQQQDSVINKPTSAFKDMIESSTVQAIDLSYEPSYDLSQSNYKSAAIPTDNQMIPDHSHTTSLLNNRFTMDENFFTPNQVTPLNQLSANIPSDQIVADQTLQNSLAALSSLSTLLNNPAENDEPVTKSDKGAQTVNEMVRELITPMLKAWLDEHLPATVEQIVKSEVERIIRYVKK